MDSSTANLRLASEAVRVAVVIPCLDEEATIADVVRDFARVLPGAEIYVFDNGSTDATAEVARRAGGRVIVSPQRGKGNVVRHMSHAVDADVYVLVDGDGTYSADAAPALVEQLRRERLDMLVATRLEAHADGAFRPFHTFGNRLVSRLVSALFSTTVTDVLSGYRVLSRELVKLVRLRARGFEVETELTLQALAKRFSVREVPVPYGRRPPGSRSKLSTWGDGLIILKCLLLIFKDYRPLYFFSVAAIVFGLASVAAGIGPVLEFYRTGLVYQVPRAVLAAALGVLATISLAVGLILDTVSRYHQETIELWRQQHRTLDEFQSARGHESTRPRR
jgi:glycosyltransferase involved in cell wall biosynthesis